jgi:UvrD-like helicase C-terminal domain
MRTATISPLRTTREIAEAAQSLFEIILDIRSEDDDEIYPAPTDHLQSGGMPGLIQYSTPQEEEEQLIHQLAARISSGTNPGHLAVFTPRYAPELKIKVEEPGVYYGPFNLMKGLEFDVVYIAKLDELVHSQWNKRAIMRRMLYRKLFVAMTRARRELSLSHVEPLPENVVPLANFFNTSNSIHQF